MGRLVRDHGLEITLFQPFRDFEGMPEPHRSRTFDRAERKFDIMQQLGTDLLLVCSNVSPVSCGGIDRAAADFHELGERAAKRGLKAGYEALAWERYGEPKSLGELEDYQINGYIRHEFYGLNYLGEISEALIARLSSTNIASQYMMTAQGMGIGLLPDFIAIQDQRLVRILPGHKLVRSYYLSYASNMARLARVRTTIDTLTEWVRDAKDVLLPPEL